MKASKKEVIHTSIHQLVFALLSFSMFLLDPSEKKKKKATTPSYISICTHDMMPRYGHRHGLDTDMAVLIISLKYF